MTMSRVQTVWSDITASQKIQISVNTLAFVNLLSVYNKTYNKTIDFNYASI